jgi:hypothetical protein
MGPSELLGAQLHGNAIGVATVVAIILLCALFASWD